MNFLARHPEELGRFRLVAFRSLEGLRDEVLLEIVEFDPGCRQGEKAPAMIVKGRWPPENHVVGRDGGARPEEGCALEDVPQLPNVPGPVVTLELLQCLVGYAIHLLSELKCELLDEMLCQRGYVFAPLTQRRNIDGDGISMQSSRGEEPPDERCLRPLPEPGRV